MTRPSSPPDDQESGYIVRAPRATDALGSALRQAYGKPPAVPAEWQCRLDQIDRRR
jgi:hypothetical protein